MVNLNLSNDDDEELLQKAKKNFIEQIDKGIEDLDHKLKDMLALEDLKEIAGNLDYLTISRFNLMLTKDYLESEYAFKSYSYQDNICKLAVRRKTLKMIADNTGLADKIMSEAFTGAFKFEYAAMFTKSPEDYFNKNFFSIIEECIYDKEKKGK